MVNNKYAYVLLGVCISIIGYCLKYNWDHPRQYPTVANLQSGDHYYVDSKYVHVQKDGSALIDGSARVSATEGTVLLYKPNDKEIWATVYQEPIVYKKTIVVTGASSPASTPMTPSEKARIDQLQGWRAREDYVLLKKTTTDSQGYAKWRGQPDLLRLRTYSEPIH